MEYLKKKEIDSLTKNIKYEKNEIASILQSKIKKYKFSREDMTKIKKELEALTNKKNLPRYLTEKELNYIVDDLPIFSYCIKEINEMNLKQIKEKVKFDLSSYKVVVTKESLEKMKRIIYETYCRTLVDAGESVGINGAMSLGQLLTQLNLNTFHSSGSANSTESGLKMITELFNVSKDRSKNLTTVHFKNKDLTREEIYLYNKALRGVTVQDVINYTEPLTKILPEDELWYHNYEIINKNKINRSKKFLRIHLNVYRCYFYGISITDIANLIEKSTRVESKKSVFCITTSTFKGIIDVHSEEEFIQKTVVEFSTKGKTFKNCRKRYFFNYRKTDEDEDIEVTPNTYIKTPIDFNSSIKDLSSIFLTVILSDCFKYMVLLGVNGIESIRCVTLKLASYLKYKKISTEKEIVKYTSEPYNLDPESSYRLYNIYIDKISMSIHGIPEKKYTKFFKSCGIEVLEENFSHTFPHCVILMPEVPDEMFVNEEGEKENRFVKQKDGVYDVKEKKYVITSEEPSKLLVRKLTEAEDKLKKDILERVEEKSYSINLDYPEPYRHGYYCFVKAEGKGIVKDLLRSKIVDRKFTIPENVNDVYDIYGIDAARLFLIKEYTSLDAIKKMNPVNIELLVDFQTNMGQLLSVTSADVSKFSNSPLSAASFEQPMVAFYKASSMGKKESIQSVSSCLVTGKKCENGTGIVDVYTSSEYLKNLSNKVDISNEKDLQINSVSMKDLLGSCFAPGKLVENKQEDDTEKKPELIDDESEDDLLLDDETDIPDLDLDETVQEGIFDI